MTQPAGTSRSLTILLTCVGRRVELLQAFRASAKRLGVNLRIVATDRTPTAPALTCADQPILVPSIDDDGYIPALCQAIERSGAKALIPTIDSDLLPLSKHREQFAALGCTALVADPSTIEICRDKIKTYELLKTHGIETPLTSTAAEMLGRDRHCFPYFIKPRFGSAGQNTVKINDMLDLEYFAKRIDQPIVQEFVDGVEHTLDAYVGLTGEVRCVVPRRRWQVRDGEVIKGVVVKDLEIMQAGKRVVELLGRSTRGVVTAQCIVTPDRRIRFIEMNARFGGGAPLAIAAGADLSGWLIQSLLGEEPQIAFDGFQHGLSMFRYDWSAFVQQDDDLEPKLRDPLRPYPRFE